MYTKQFLAAAALALGASAQGSNMNLTALLGSENQLSALTSLLGQYPDLATSLGKMKDVTLFAPNNAAIQQLTQSGLLAAATDDDIANILMYHVIPSKVYSSDITDTPQFVNTALTNTSYTNVTDGQVVGVFLDGQDALVESGFKMEATVVTPDLNYTNGVVHIIDQVLTVPYNVSVTALAADLTALAGALVATDLLTTLDEASDITIFAPTNEAFSAIGSAAGNLSISQLASILEYHVINGTIAYSSALGNGTVESMAGTDLNITVIDGAVFVNAARVINADILVAGGVIHVIDSVLNPNGTAAPKPNNDMPAVQYSSASSAPLAITSNIPAPTTTMSGLAQTTDNVAEGYSTVKGGAIGTGAGGNNKPTGGSGGSGSSSSSGIAALPTGMVGAAALFGGAALVANW